MMLGQTVLDASASAQLAPLQLGGGFLELALLFAILAIVAAVVGASGVAGISMTIAKWFVIIFVVLAVLSLVI
jgi:uncharacterized membrane protein YtjA (UPF0391 family)